MSAGFSITPVCFRYHVHMVHVVQATVLLIACIAAVSNPRGDVDVGRAAKCAVREKLPFPGVWNGCWDLSTSFSFSSCQPSLVGWQAGQRDIPTSCHEFNALFSLIPKGQGSLMEEGIACCESPLVQGLLEEGAAFDREHGMPETAF